MSITAIAGLGNPGAAYTGTRHNMGFMLVDALAEAEGLTWKRDKRFEADLAEWRTGGRRYLLIKPQTFMNESGRSIGAVARFYKWSPSQIVVAYDEVNVDFGRLKISLQGSAGGHNGIESLLRDFGNGFIRFRLGVGPKVPPQIDMKDYVLGKFPPDELSRIETVISRQLDGLKLLVRQGPEAAMQKLHQRSDNNNESNDTKSL